MAIYTVTTLDDELDSANGTTISSMGGANDLSLREAIALSNRNAGSDTIRFSTSALNQNGLGHRTMRGAWASRDA